MTKEAIFLVGLYLRAILNPFLAALRTDEFLLGRIKIVGGLRVSLAVI